MLAQNGAESISIDMPISYLKNMLPTEWRNIYLWKGYSIDKSFLSKVSSSNTCRSPIDRYFREANVLSDFRFEDKTDNFWKHFYEEFF